MALFAADSTPQNVMLAEAGAPAIQQPPSGTNSSVQFDSLNNPVNVTGFDAGIGWDATTGTGSPIASSLVDYLGKYVSPGDGVAAIATTKPKPHSEPIIPGGKNPH